MSSDQAKVEVLRAVVRPEKADRANSVRGKWLTDREPAVRAWFVDCIATGMTSEAVEGEAVRGGAVEGEVVKGEVVKGETVKGEAVKGEAVKGEAVKGVSCSIQIGGVDFLLVPALSGGGRVESRGRSASAMRRRLWEARRDAGLTQAQLAQRLGRSQSMVAGAESGTIQVGERYLKMVLEACGVDPEVLGQSSEALSGWDLDPRDVVGIDPERLEPVRRGSERDLELRKKLVWWEGYEDET